ncbi:MAG: APC family permease [Gemmatimonadetes bacterium]|nr:APC family permease [Gemmatimonadota bacterium]
MRGDPRSGGSERATLRKAVGAGQFFTIAFGTIIGVGWVIYLGYWLEPAGPLGAVIGFSAGTVLVALIGLCYAEMAAMFPVSGGEVAYTYEAFGTGVSFITGWLLAFIYTAVTAWEAIAVGVLARDLFPGWVGPRLYAAFGAPVHVGPLVLGLAAMAFFTTLNYRGLRGAARVQDVLTYGFLAVSVLFIGAGLVYGDVDNLTPAFVRSDSGSVLPGIVAAFITAPFFLAGFDVIPQVMEERKDETPPDRAARMIVLALAAAGVFYVLVILSASLVAPWERLLEYESLPAARAFDQAFDSAVLSRAILVAAFIGILTTFNAVFMGASRVLFALSRAHMIPTQLSWVHPRFDSPGAAVLFVGLLGALGVVLGEGAIRPVVNVATMGFGIAFGLVSWGVIRLRRRRPDAHRPYRVPGGIATASAAVLASGLFVYLAATDPYEAGGGIPLEWILLAVALGLGWCFWLGGSRPRATITEDDRRRLILGSE